MGLENEPARIMVTSDQSTMILNPQKISTPAMEEILEYQIFNSERRRIIYTNPDGTTKEIGPLDLIRAAESPGSETMRFIKETGRELSFANRIIIERLDIDTT